MYVEVCTWHFQIRVANSRCLASPRGMGKSQQVELDDIHLKMMVRHNDKLDQRT